MSDAGALGAVPVEPGETDVAIVGMSGRFPGAPTPDDLWRRVEAAEDCLTDLTREEILAEGVSADLVDDPAYVRRAGVLTDLERFDAALFGIAPRDAAIMDPQHRHFMECAWAALESAAIVPSRFDGAIGVFAGSGMNTYLVNNLLADQRLVDELGWFLLRHTGNDKDFLTTEVSYRLDLRGPSVNVQTACSTSLVAVHLAVQSLLGFECDAALAGGVTIEVPHRTGHLHREGEILSADGRCRAFDAESSGTVLTSGVGVVVLRRLADALDDGDPILAVIKGSAVNNDGSRKVSYLAPSVEGHTDVVREALAVAGLVPADLQFVETHGTGTALGDPIELAALGDALRGAPVGSIRIGSTKPNIGHLDTAAGVASLIKVVQSLRHRTLPPMANHTAPSELIALDGSPFALSGSAAPWPAGRPRRAGVSSLGVGGTNAHVVVQEAPPVPESPDAAGPHLVPISAATEESLLGYAADLAEALDGPGAPALVDVGHTLAVGRADLGIRDVVVASDAEGVAAALRALRPRRDRTIVDLDRPVRTVFTFPGGGSQHPGMSSALGPRWATFHHVRDEVVAAVADHGGVDLRPLLDASVDPSLLEPPTVALPLVFATSVAVARQWIDWGVVPDALLGHSLGEYAAAHLAGVMSIEDATRLVVVRAALMERVGGPGASMLVAPISEAEAAHHVGADVSLAVVNSADELVLAGRSGAIDQVAATLAADGFETGRVRLAAAAHSVLLDPVLDEFREEVRTVALAAPTIPYTTNLTGTWATVDDATSAEHWVQHLRGTVRFADCLETVLDGAPTVTVEMGPGHALSSLARRAGRPPIAAVGSLRHPRRDEPDEVAALAALGAAWAAGVGVDLTTAAAAPGRKVHLPTYAFRGGRHWIDRSSVRPPADLDEGATELGRIDDVAAMWWERRWEDGPATTPAAPRRWWVVADADDPRRGRLVDGLDSAGHAVSGMVEPGDIPVLVDGDALVVLGPRPGDAAAGERLAAATRRWLADAVDLARAAGGGGTTDHLVVLVTQGAVAIDGPASDPAQALARGVALVAPREYPGLVCRWVDQPDSDGAAIAGDVIDEITSTASDPVVVRGDGVRLVPSLRSASLDDAPPAPPSSGTRALVTGGLGGVGSVLAQHLGCRPGAHIAVVTSSPMPVGTERDRWRSTHGPLERTSQRLEHLAALEANGATVEVLVGDVADPDDVQRIVAEAVDRLGGLDLVVHAAGVLRDGPLETLDVADVEAVVGAKARGALSLVDAARAHDVARVVLVSSTSTEIASPGQASYVAASSVLDEVAGRHGGTYVSAFGSGMWSGVGMAAGFERQSRLGLDPGRPVAHPVFEEVVEDRSGAVDVVGHLDSSWHWQVDQHRDASGAAVLPGTGHLWLLVDAVRLGLGRSAPVALRDVALDEPLVVPDGEPLLLRARIEADGSRVHLESDAGPEGWRRHSSAVIGEPIAAHVDAARLDPGPEATSCDVFAGQRAHLRLGPRWSPEVSAHLDDRAAIGTIVPVEESTGTIDVALLDAATGLAVQVVRRAGGGDALWVPIGYRSVEWHGSATGPVSAQVVRVDDTSSVVDLCLSAADGTIIVAISGLELWQVRSDLFGADAAAAAPTPPGRRSTVGDAVANGIRPDEGALLFEALLADGRPRLLASTLDLPSLVDAAASAVEAPRQVVIDGVGGDDVDGVVRAAWSSLLGIDHPDDTDDFFDSGGHSLIAIRLLAAIRRASGVDIRLTELFAAPTLGELVALVEERHGGPEPGAAGEHSSVVPIVETGSGAPLFVVHGAGGGVLFLWSLARALGATRPVYGIQAAGVEGECDPDPTVEAMAERYARDIRAARPGPYLIAGYSGGGLIALEVAARLRAEGAEVGRVVLLDGVPPGCAEPSRADRVKNFWGHVARGRWRALAPFARRWRSHGGRSVPLTPPPELVEDPSLVDLFDHISAAAAAHGPGRHDVDVAVVKADLTWPVQPWDYYWTDHVHGDLQILTSPGDHFTMFTAPLVTDLARTLGEVLDASDPSP